MTRYVRAISEPAVILDPSATPKTFAVIEAESADSPFKYLDTASSRAEIGVANEKLKIGPVAIVGLGGTGSYILDLVAKTPVQAIHLFDDDKFLQHNAFRAPGATSYSNIEESVFQGGVFQGIVSAYAQPHSRPWRDRRVDGGVPEGHGLCIHCSECFR